MFLRFPKVYHFLLQIALDGVNLIMIVFLFISILFTMVNVLIFRAHLSRLYGFILVALYVIFLVFIILSETGVLVWLPEP